MDFEMKGLGISPFYGDVYRSPLYAVLLDRQSTITSYILYKDNGFSHKS